MTSIVLRCPRSTIRSALILVLEVGVGSDVCAVVFGLDWRWIVRCRRMPLNNTFTRQTCGGRTVGTTERFLLNRLPFDVCKIRQIAIRYRTQFSRTAARIGRTAWVRPLTAIVQVVILEDHPVATTRQQLDTLPATIALGITVYHLQHVLLGCFEPIDVGEGRPHLLEGTIDERLGVVEIRTVVTLSVPLDQNLFLVKLWSGVSASMTFIDGLILSHTLVAVVGSLTIAWPCRANVKGL